MVMRELKFEPIFTPLDCDRHLDKDKTCTLMSDPKPTSRLRAQHPISTPIPPSLQAKMAQFANRANNMETNTKPILGMAARRQRPAFSLRDIDPSILPDPTPFCPTGGGPLAAGLGAGRPSLLHLEQTRKPTSQSNFGSPFSNFSKIVYDLSLSFSTYHLTILRSDPSGALNFNGKAVLHAAGVNFSNGASFAINMGQLQLDEELGKGNYGTVKKVLHKPTNVAMAMKVPLFSLFSFLSFLISIIGNTLRTRRFKTKCYHHGTRCLASCSCS